MANDTLITVVGNLTADPTLRYAQTGAPVVDFTVASTPRTFDKNTNQWKDGESLFLRCSAWKQYAENIAESLSKGMRVIVQGRLVQRKYTPRDGGDERTVVELQVEEVGPALRYATAQVSRTERRGGVQEAHRGAYSQQPPNGSPSDPWGAQNGSYDFQEEAAGNYGTERAPF